MRAVVQRVRSARVTVGGEITGEIGLGLLVLLGVGAGDTARLRQIIWRRRRLRLRIFEDAGGKMNLSVGEVGGRCWWCRSSLFMAMCGGASGHRLIGRLLRTWRGSFMNILWRGFAGPGCGARLDGFRRRCRWNWSTTGRLRFCWILRRRSEERWARGTEQASGAGQVATTLGRWP